MTDHNLYQSNRDVVERALKYVCRERRFTAQDADDFCQASRLHLLKDDCAVIRAHRGESSLNTYLVAVLVRYSRDWRDAQWGKWRPSAEAERLGPLAVQFERLVVRDGWEFEEARQELSTRFAEATPAALETLAARLPVRHRRTHVSEEVLDVLPSSLRRPDEAVEAREAAGAARGAATLLADAMTSLPPDDQVLIQMRYVDGTSIADIARALRLDQKPLYRRFDRLLAHLREALELAGLTSAVAGAMLASSGFAELDMTPRETPEEVRLFKGRDASSSTSRRPD